MRLGGRVYAIHKGHPIKSWGFQIKHADGGIKTKNSRAQSVKSLSLKAHCVIELLVIRSLHYWVS